MTHSHTVPRSQTITRESAVGFLAALFFASIFGCQYDSYGTYPNCPRPPGSIVDRVNRMQEDGAEAAKLIIYMHEFELNKPEWEHRLGVPGNGPPQGFRLSPSGMDHVRQIAAILYQNPEQDHVVVVERNRTTNRPMTQHRYAVHFGDELDLERRDIVVRTLETLGIEDAASRVIVAPAYPEGMSAQEAATAYDNSFQQQQSRGGSQAAGGGTF